MRLTGRRSASASSEKTPLGKAVEFVVVVAVAVGLALGIQAFLVKPYRIPSPSMVPTLEVGQRVLVNRIGHAFTPPSVGDVVVFHPPVGAGSAVCGVEHPPTQVCPRAVPRRDSQNFIKRVVAGPGDRIRLERGHVILNGERQEEPFTRPCGVGQGCDYPDEITIPAGHYFMMGDNRGSSDDSRFWGPIPDEWIVGGAFATYWPPDRLGPL